MKFTKYFFILFIFLLLPSYTLAIAGSGGVETIDGAYTVHTFTSSGTFNITAGGTAEMLIVAGGGGGGDGSPQGGAGGAGGLLFGNYTFTEGSYSITIGAGGAGSAADAQGATGSDSSINTSTPLTAKGGGGGGGGGAAKDGLNGGSGGGTGSGSGNTAGTSTQTSISTLTGYGNVGGTSLTGTTGGSGGGGATSVGGNGSSSTGGNGGLGLNTSISGSLVCYAGGGGGAAYSGQGQTSVGSATCGGGNGGGTALASNGVSGTANTGGGGGGADDGTGGNGGSGVVIVRYLTPSNIPFLNIKIQDIYNSSNLEGLNVTLNNGASNLTDSSGEAYFDNQTSQSFNVTDPDNLYFDYNSSSDASENATSTYKIYGAFVNLTAYDLGINQVTEFNVSSGEQTNTTSTNNLLLYLPPNQTVTVLVNGSDYISGLAVNITTTAQDTGNYNLTGLYQTVLRVSVEDYLGSTIQYFDTNVSGEGLNLSETTTNFTNTFNLIYGNYTLNTLPINYSLTNESIEIVSGNVSPNVTMIAYTLNTLFLYFYDEVTQALITDNMSIELISSASAQTYYTSSGNLTLEVLTPSEYTLRYKSVDGNYTERDYYQTLVNLNSYNISLYSLLLSDSTDTLITVLDTGGDFVEGATVKLMRYYASCNCYPVVEMGKTDSSGGAYFISDAYDGHYKMAVDYQGTNHFLSTEPSNFIPESGVIEKSITINLGDAYFESFRESTDFNTVLTYNNDTKSLSFTWSDPSGIVTSGCLYASYLVGVNYVNLPSSCQNASTGSVVMTLNNSEASYKYYAELTTSTTYSEYIPFSGTIEKLKDLLLTDPKVGAFLGGFFVVFLALVFSFSAIATMVSVAISVIGLGFLGIFTISISFITGFVALILGFAAFMMRK